MSSAGINPLAIYDPQTYAAQLAIQRRQGLAQALLQQGEQNPGNAAYGGLRNAGNTILGAFLAKRADKQLGDLYSPQNVPNVSPQVSNSAGAQSPNSQMGSALKGGGSLDEEGNPITQAPQPNTAMPAAAPAMPQNTTNPADYASLPPNAQRIYDQIPHIPGMGAKQALNYFMSNPQGYQAEWAKQYEMTPEQKNAMFVNPGNEALQRQAVGGVLNKAGTLVGRPGGMMTGADGQVTYIPAAAPAGYRYVQGPDNAPHLVQIDNGPQAVAGSALASQVPKALLTPHVGYGADNLPQASNDLQMSGNGGLANQLIPGINPQATQQVESGGNPYAVSPAGAVGPMQTMPHTLQQPGFGVAPAQAPGPQEQGRVGADYLSAMQTKYQNPVLAHIAYNMGPGNTDKWIAAGGDFSKLPDETQKYLGRIAVSQAMQGRQQQAPQQSQQSTQQGRGLLPELPQGQATYMQGQAKDAADRHDQAVAAAAESPMRINVLDNIIGLSKQGVATGPGQEWQTNALGVLSNLPGLSKVLGPAKDNVAKFQELQKFTYQNAIRSWQAAGGTGTDAQMQSMAHANPNDHLFPQALQQIAQWGKAAELAVQAKANAQDRFLAQSGQSPQNQIKFENTWRNAFDPKVFQYSLMSPQEKQVFAQHELKTPQAAQAFIAKQKQLQAMGAMQ